MAKKEKAVQPTQEKAAKAKEENQVETKVPKAKEEKAVASKGTKEISPKPVETKRPSGIAKSKVTGMDEKTAEEKKGGNVKMSSTTTGSEKLALKNEKLKAKSDNLDYLMDKLKYLGFPKNDYIKEKITDIIDSKKDGVFKHYAKNESTIGSNNVTFDIKINHSKNNDKFYFGGYDAKLTNKNKGIELDLSMVSSSNTYTAKEAINLLEGRMVKREFENKAKGFVGIDFASPKNEYGNHKLNVITQKDKLDVAKVVNNSAIVLKENPKYSNEKLKEFLTKSLEKGNLVKSQIDTKEGVKDGYVRYDAFKGEMKYHDEKLKSISEDRLNISAAKSVDKGVENEESPTGSLKR